MEVVRNIVYLIGGLLAVSYLLFSGRLPEVLLEYRLPIVGAYLLILALTEYLRRRENRR